MAPKKLHSQTSILPFSFFLFMFLRNNNDSFGLRRLEMTRNRVDANREKSKSGFTDHVEIRNEGMMRQWWRNGEPIGMIAEMKGW